MADKISAKVEDIHNVVIWGNHSLTQMPDLNNAVLLDKQEKKEILKLINDSKWVNDTFIPTVAKRGAAII